MNFIIISILLCVCIALIISMWLCLSRQMINMKEELSDINLTVNYTSEVIRDYFLRLWDHINHLTTEIKDSKGIKQIKSEYDVGDVLKINGVEFFVFYKTELEDGRTRLTLFGQNGDDYRMYADDMPENIEFIKHVDIKSLFS